MKKQKKTYKNVSIRPEVHRKLKVMSAKRGMSIAAFIELLVG